MAPENFKTMLRHECLLGLLGFSYPINSCSFREISIKTFFVVSSCYSRSFVEKLAF